MTDQLIAEYEFSPSHHDTAEALAQALIPESPLGPSASEANVASIHLKRALTLRPDHVPRFERLLDEAEREDPRDYLTELQRSRPQDFEALTFLIAGAYFLDPQVREWLGYNGQLASPDAGPGPGEPTEEELLALVSSQGKTYRPTTWTVGSNTGGTRG